MIRTIQISVIIVLTSFFLFPFFFSFLPSINTKMMMAVLGLICFALDLLNNRTQEFWRSLFKISIYALGVSLCSFLSMTINNTPDNSYLGYIISMWVWLFAAYSCISLMKSVHKHISVEIIGYYLMAVALMQCTLALLINHYPILQNLTETYITGEKYMGVEVEERLYGIGCALDVGGGRLGAILIIMAYLILLSIKQQKNKWVFFALVSASIYILIIGNMIGRTISVGAAIALIYFICSLLFNPEMRSIPLKPFLFITLIVVLIGGFICINLYQTDPESQKLLRFGFEAFFNYFEYGKFETHSTNMLSEGLIFPDNFKTWLIGDGYMASGSNDPYYTGPSDYGFYMNTDAGYSRFIFYFGQTGLSVFILFFITVCRECIKKSEDAKYLFIAILLLNLCIWIKVSTDIFVIFAPFLCLVNSNITNKAEIYNKI